MSDTPEIFRERAIERMIGWREIASDYAGADLLRARDPAELERCKVRIDRVARQLHMGELI